MKIALLYILLLIGVSFGAEEGFESFAAKISQNEAFREFLAFDFTDVDQNTDQFWSLEESMGDHGFFFAEKQFKDADTNRDGRIAESEFVDHQIREVFYALDWNDDGKLTGKEEELTKSIPRMFRWLERGTLSFVVEGNVAYCNGNIKGRVVRQFKALFKKHPQIKKLVLGWIPGSMDDERMLEALELIRKHGVDTHASDHARIYSGGVDLFTVGQKRTMGEDVEFGVHTWTMGRKKEGRKFSKKHRLHRPYVNYYDSIEVPVEFYWFTLEASDGQGMHLMTKEELKKYHLISVE